MNLTRFEPWSVVDLLHRDLERIKAASNDRSQNDYPVADWAPAVDIIEEKGRFVLRADLPGVNPADIDVSMDAGVLTISGERKREDVAEEESFRRTERVSGRFHRRFTLPESANAEQIVAKSSNGILEVSIAKQPEVQARRITVEAA
jgi:HSP20 family protein